MTEKPDPLDALSIQAGQLDEENRARLAKLILPYVRIDFEEGEIVLLPDADRLNTKHKVLLCLLASLARNTKNPKFPTELSGAEIEKISHLPPGTIRPKLSELVADRIAVKMGKGYAVRFLALPKAENALQSKAE
jgi:hypothetical protein